MKKKTCSKCKAPKPLKEFSPHVGKSDGKQPWCKSCVRESNNKRYKENPKPTYVRKRASVKRNQERVLDYLKSHPCVDCGEDDVVVLDFDHVKGKKRITISKAIRFGYSWETIIKEIAKCVVRCANDHRRKTAREQKFFRCGA